MKEGWKYDVGGVPLGWVYAVGGVEPDIADELSTATPLRLPREAILGNVCKGGTGGTGGIASLSFSSLELAFSTGRASHAPCTCLKSGSLPAALTPFPVPVLELDALELERRSGRDDACELELPLWNDAGDPSRPEILEKKLARRPRLPSFPCCPCCCCSSACAWSLVAVPGRL